MMQKYPKYIIDADMMLVRVPYMSEAYHEIKDFIKQHADFYANPLEQYERVYTKGELALAEFYLLRIENIVYTSAEPSEFEYCCSNKCFVTRQVNDMMVEPSSMKNKCLGFATNYRFVISEVLKKKLEYENVSNLYIRPVWSKRNRNTPSAYQLGTKERMVPIAELNGWVPYKQCKKSGEMIFSSNYANQLTITRSIADGLRDINETSETFSELGAHGVIISKKVYMILLDCGTKRLKCEPVRIIG